MPRLFAISDLHVDHSVNMEHVLALSAHDYCNDALIIAGDVTECLDRMDRLFDSLRAKFRSVSFVPGNHELWVRRDPAGCSLEKFWAVINLCREFDIHTAPHRIGCGNAALWIVPLFSWYCKPEQGSRSLYIPKVDEDQSRVVWGDDYFCRWAEGVSPADYFLQLNQVNISRNYDAPVITFSHFLPRRELMFATRELIDAYGRGDTPIGSYPNDPLPSFNFSRVAGDFGIEQQLRQVRAILHVYGHQHRDRDIRLEGVRYVSHCLGSWHEHRLRAGTPVVLKNILDGLSPAQ